MIKVIQWLNLKPREKLDEVIKYIEDNYEIPLTSVHDIISTRLVKFMFRNGHYFYMSFEMLNSEPVDLIIDGIKDIPGDWI